MAKKDESLTATSPMPPELQQWLMIRMLGEPFAEMGEDRKIRRGYTFEGKKYYYGEKT